MMTTMTVRTSMAGLLRQAKASASEKRGRRWMLTTILAVASSLVVCAVTVTSAHAQTFSTVYSFTGGGDGNNPYAGLVMDSSGNLYGTTLAGGAGGDGTVFKLDPSGNETILHSFGGSFYADGGSPYAGLVMDPAGNLYGTTKLGGTRGNGGEGYGTVFKLDPSGKETILHSFNLTDGAFPYAGLTLDSAGNLYGATVEGGSSNDGTVFKIDTSGKETILHSFNLTYGAHPYAGLTLDSAGNLYGTTFDGGSTGNNGEGYGTVFKIALSVPFSAFSTKLDITSGPPPGFQLKANFAQGIGAAAIHPFTQAVTLSVGTYTVTIPAGSFKALKRGAYAFEGTINGAAIQVRILQTGTNSYQFQFEASGVDLTALANPVSVTLSIGQNTGTTQVTADF